MNTFIKRSMMLGLSLVFIGAAALPSCAQKKGITKLPKALGKKPPLTGTAPVVKPVTPHVPPTLKGAQVPTRFAVPNEALNAAVERKVSTQENLAQVNFQLTLLDSFKEGKIPNALSNGFSIKDWNQIVNFTNFITPATPNYVVITKWRLGDFSDHIYHYKNKGIHFKNKSFSLAEFTIRRPVKNIRRICDELDERFFIYEDEQTILNVAAVKDIRSYGEAVKEAIRQENFPKNVNMDEVFFSVPVQHFIAARNLQILKALQGTKPQTVEPTTQRTAEEIKSLVENLDPQNPLRQAIEGTLKANGYIIPAK